jgi:biopolymer transport protein ExbD
MPGMTMNFTIIPIVAVMIMIIMVMIITMTIHRVGAVEIAMGAAADRLRPRGMI